MKGEWKGWELLVKLVEEVTGDLVLKSILVLNTSLVDSGTVSRVPWLTLTGRHSNLDGPDITSLEDSLWDLGVRLSEEDRLGTIDDVVLHLVHNGVRDSVDTEDIGDLLDGSSNLVVLVADLEHLGSNLSSGVGGRDDVLTDGKLLSSKLGSTLN